MLALRFTAELVAQSIATLVVVLFAAFICAVSPALAAEIPLDERKPGYDFMGRETRAMQDDDTANPGMFAVLDGEALWNRKAGAAQKSCADCHGDAAASMKGVAARYPAFSRRAGGRSTSNSASTCAAPSSRRRRALAPESKDLLALEAYIGRQSRGMPIAVAIDGRARPFFEAGRATFLRRQGQLNFACASCHDDNWREKLAGSPITQAHPTGYPLYRLEWQSVGSLQRRLRSCLAGMRAEPYPYGADELVDLELYLKWRARGHDDRDAGGAALMERAVRAFACPVAVLAFAPNSRRAQERHSREVPMTRRTALAALLLSSCLVAAPSLGAVLQAQRCGRDHGPLASELGQHRGHQKDVRRDGRHRDRCGRLTRVTFPGVVVILNLPAGPRRRPPAPLGSVVNHVGFMVKNIPDSIAKWKAGGVPVVQGNGTTTALDQAYVTTADGLRIEILEDKNQAMPIRHEHVHFAMPESEMAKSVAWYGKIFGAKPGADNRMVADIPGAQLRFSKPMRRSPPPKAGCSITSASTSAT